METPLSISAPLQRKIKSGKEYNKYIPKASNTSNDFGNGKNNTIEGVEFMALWVLKHSSQVKDLAKILIGKTLKETVNNIYNFLYWHIQYLADGSLQNLHSPSSSWNNRKKGIDCKSFTIFAMCLLREMGVNAVIRQVKQPYFHPDLFTHVYVVVPINQQKKSYDNEDNYLIIDATKTPNTEVAFVDHKDKFMASHKYIGLNGPTQSKERLTSKEYRALGEFKARLLNAGFSSFMATEVLSYITGLFDAGYTRDQILVFPSQKGLHVKPDAKSSGKIFAPKSNGLNGNFDWIGDVIGGINTNNGSNNTTQSGSTAGEIFNVVSETGWFNSTFGAVFSNGLNLSCWGSSYSPKQSQEDVAVDLPFLLEESGLKNNPNSNTLSKFMNATGAYLGTAQNGQTLSAKCSRDGWAKTEQATILFQTQVLDLLRKSGYTITRGALTEGAYSTKLPGYARGRTFAWGTQYGGRPYKYYKYTVSGSGNGNISTPNTNTGGTPTGGGTVVVGSGNYTPTTPTTGNLNKKDNSNLIIGGIATAGIALLAFPKIKKALKK